MPRTQRIRHLADFQTAGYAPQLANTPASCSRQTAQATPKGLLRLPRALVWDIMCGQTGTRTEMDYEVCVATDTVLHDFR